MPSLGRSPTNSLADRGLRGVKLVIADDHKGLRAAASKVFNAGQQRCHRHDQDDLRAGNRRSGSPAMGTGNPIVSLPALAA